MKIFLYTLLILLLLSCDKKDVHVLRKIDNQSVVLALGDSLTAGYGVDGDSNYPFLLSKAINHPIINSGISGNTTEDVLARLDDVISGNHPTLVLLCIGGNDMLRKVENNVIKNNIVNIVNQLKSQKIEILLIATPIPNPFEIKNNPIYQEIAKENNIPLEDQAFVSVMGKNNLKVDPIHPNQQGYKIVIKHIKKTLEKTGAI